MSMNNWLAGACLWYELWGDDEPQSIEDLSEHPASCQLSQDVFSTLYSYRSEIHISTGDALAVWENSIIVYDKIAIL